jgi:hypothetical protein
VLGISDSMIYFQMIRIGSRENEQRSLSHHIINDKRQNTNIKTQTSKPSLGPTPRNHSAIRDIADKDTSGNSSDNENYYNYYYYYYDDDDDKEKAGSRHWIHTAEMALVVILVPMTESGV